MDATKNDVLEGEGAVPGLEHQTDLNQIAYARFGKKLDT